MINFTYKRMALAVGLCLSTKHQLIAKEQSKTNYIKSSALFNHKAKYQFYTPYLPKFNWLHNSEKSHLVLGDFSPIKI